MRFDELRSVFAPVPELWVATTGADGAPHVAPRWFVWTEEGIHVACDRDSRTWRNLESDPRLAVGSDLGRAWGELSGFVLEGTAELLAAEDPRMRAPISAWHEKYRSLLADDGFERLTARIAHLGFLRIDGGETRSWDHRA